MLRAQSQLALKTLLAVPEHEAAVDLNIAVIRTAIERTRVDAANVVVTDDLPHHIVSQTRRKVIYLNRARLKNASPEEIEHRLRHEEAHRHGIYDCGLAELSIAGQNTTGKIYYPAKQRATKRATDILDPVDGVKKAVLLYKRKKFQHLYDMFMFAARKKRIRTKEANEIFRAAFPKLASTKAKLYKTL
jgi:hypothetical protein